MATDQVTAASAAYDFENSEVQDLLDRLQAAEPLIPASHTISGPISDPSAEALVSEAAAAETPADAVIMSSQPGNEDRPAQPAIFDPELSQGDSTALAMADAEPIISGVQSQECPLADHPAGNPLKTGLANSASSVGLQEGYAADSDSSVSGLKQSRSAASIAGSTQLNTGEAPVDAATVSTVGPAAVDEQGPEEAVGGGDPAAGQGQRRDLSSAKSADLHRSDEPHRQMAETVPDNSHSGCRDNHTASSPQQSAAAGPDPGTATDVADSRTESSADGLTPSVSRSHLAEGYAADSDTSVGGRNQRHHAGSTSVGPQGPAEQRSRQLTGEGASVNPIPEVEGEHLSTGVPEELPPPAAPLGLHDRHESGNLADAEDEPPTEQAAAALVPFGDASRIQEVSEGTAADVAVQSEPGNLPSGMFSGLELA